MSVAERDGGDRCRWSVAAVLVCWLVLFLTGCARPAQAPVQTRTEAAPRDPTAVWVGEVCTALLEVSRTRLVVAVPDLGGRDLQTAKQDTLTYLHTVGAPYRELADRLTATGPAPTPDAEAAFAPSRQEISRVSGLARKTETDIPSRHAIAQLDQDLATITSWVLTAEVTFLTTTQTVKVSNPTLAPLFRRWGRC